MQHNGGEGDEFEKNTDGWEIFKDIAPAPEDRIIMRERYIQGKSWRAVANYVGYSEQRVYQMHRESLERLESIRAASVI